MEDEIVLPEVKKDDKSALSAADVQDKPEIIALPDMPNDPLYGLVSVLITPKRNRQWLG